MRKSILLVSCILLLTTVPVWPRKFWKESAYSDWSEKQVMRMLNKSPWAKGMTVSLQRPRGVSGTTMSAGRRDGPNRSGRGFGSGGGLGGGGGGGGFGGGRGGGRGFGGRGMGRGFPPAMNLTLRWYSALPIKQAFARAQFGDQAESTAELAELLAPEENHIIVGVSGLPARMTRIPPDRQQAVVERLRSESFLKLKGREPIPLQAVQMRKDQVHLLNARTGQSGFELIFVFARPTSNPITVKEKNIEFVTRLMGRKISKKFKLKDMVFDGKLEL